MKKKVFLMPHQVQIAGWVLAGVSLLVFVGSCIFTPAYQAKADPVTWFSLMFVGLFLVGLSKEKVEDEFTVFMRTRSALTAIALMFAIRIVIALTLALALTGTWVTSAASHERFIAWYDTESHARMLKVFKEITGYGGAFMLYLIIYKIRLIRYRKESRIEE